MFGVERQNAIAELIRKSGAVRMTDLTSFFNVSTETIRRDLLALESHGVLKRTYGGAVSAGETIPFKKLNERMDEYKDLKRELSEYAVSLIDEGDIIAIDEGSTAVELADVLAENFKSLTVVTHCLDVLNRLSSIEGMHVVLCGGEFVRSENSFCGELTAESYSKLHVMKSIIFPSALSIKGGIMCGSNEFMRIQKMIMDIGDSVIVLADSSKFEKNAFYKLCNMDNAFTYVTDSGISEGLVRLYDENGIKLIYHK